MNKTAIKNYAIWARRELIERVTAKALQYGITANDIVDKNADSIDGRLLTETEKGQRQALIRKIEEQGFEQVMEEVAYTWFNRFAALRFMEVNEYLPSHIRVFTNDEGEFKPQILTEAIHLELEGLKMDKVYELKNANNDDELFKYLLIVQCNALNSILPRMFQRIADYTELLLPDNLLREGSVVERLITDISEDNFNVSTENGQIEIIGWLYQYYISEKHEEVVDPLHGKFVKKEEVPAATQLFTTDWVVRYLIDNSVGRYWIERNPNSTLVDKLTYFVKPKNGVIKTIDEKVTPQEVSTFDPCVGSGHFLIYAFDVLMKIYVEYGYSERDAAAEIVKNNLFGLDIDGRASQLAYFSVMMKARQYDRRFFSRGIQPHIYEITESNNADKLSIEYFCGDDSVLKKDVDALLDTLKDAKEYGSILQMPEVDFGKINERFAQISGEISMYSTYLLSDFQTLIRPAEIMSRKYAIVATNPPYLNKYDAKLKKYITNSYADYKGDLFSVFMYRNFGYCNFGGYSAFMTPNVWMFIASYEKLRGFIIDSKEITTLIQMAKGAFFKEATVDICAFVLGNKNKKNKGLYIRLDDFKGDMEVQRHKTLEAITEPDCGFFFEQTSDKFSKIPGSPAAYWVSNSLMSCYENKGIYDYAKPCKGIDTGDNNIFIRFWYEVSVDKFFIPDGHRPTDEDFRGKKWFPYNKGGNYRKWYGNNDYVLNWENNGLMLRNFKKSNLRNKEHYFDEGITWSTVTSGNNSFRYFTFGFLFDNGGSCLFANERLQYIQGMLNSCVSREMLHIQPTINNQPGTIGSLPLITSEIENQISILVSQNIDLAKNDWDCDETSWDFKRHPLVGASNQICVYDPIAEYYRSHSESFILEENAMRRFRMSVGDDNSKNDLVRRILETKHNKETLFPDWKGEDIIIENFAVSSSKPIQKNGKHRGSEEYPKRKEFRKKLYSEIKEVLHDDNAEEGRQIVEEYHAPEHSYDYFVSSFERSLCSHVNSLDSYNEDPKYKVLMIYYPEHALRHERDNKSDIYYLHDDRKLLNHFFENRGRYTHVIFIGEGRPEIITIDDIPQLIEKCPDDVNPVCITANTITVTRKINNPFFKNENTIEVAYNQWKTECEERFRQLKANEEELNRIFIDIYGLQDELTPDVVDKDVTVRRVFDTKDDIPESMGSSNYAITKEEVIKSLISYAVGCMMGRYSLDIEGLAYAGGEWDPSKYHTFVPDDDAILPICDDEYFYDDIVGRFVQFIEAAYGVETLEENLEFIADALGGRGTPRKVIRNYFIKDFYKDHYKTYQKRPIYWQFDSGKKNGFKCLVYMHRYQPDTIARIRTDYVHEQQARYRTSIEDFETRIASADTSERVKLTKQLTKVQEQAKELHDYEEKIHHLADQMISIDLDDGVKHNYELLKDVLAKIK